MRFLSSLSLAVSEGIWGAGLWGAPPPASSRGRGVLCCQCHTWGARAASCIMGEKCHIPSTFGFLCFVSSKHRWKNKGVRLKRDKTTECQVCKWNRNSEIKTAQCGCMTLEYSRKTIFISIGEEPIYYFRKENGVKPMYFRCHKTAMRALIC